MSYRAMILASAVFVVGAISARSDDPEPPPPVKVSNVATGATVKVKAGKGGPLLLVDTAKVTRTGSFQLDLPEKNPPTKLTLRFTGTGGQFPVFAMMGKEVKSDRVTVKVQGEGKKTVHIGPGGREQVAEKGAWMTIASEVKKDEVELVVTLHKDQKWPAAPMRVLWARGLGKK